MKWISTLIISILFASNTYAVNLDIADKEHVLWDKMPISFQVPVGSERIISFPDKIILNNIDNNLTRDKVSILNNQGSLYIKAKKVFSPVRVAVTMQSTKDVVLVDISSSENASSKHLEVILNKKQQVAENDRENDSSSKHASIDYVGLMRFAIQELYSPERLLTANNRFNRTPMYTEKSIPLYWNKPIMALPVSSWSSDNLYVTAILLKNTSSRKVDLTLDDIRGSWLAASFYPSDYIDAKGKRQDRTTLFLISAKPFSDAFNSIKEVI